MQEKLPVKIIILNNNYLGMVRQWQEMFFESRYSFVEMQNPDFVLLAKAYGIAATSISKRELITDALQQLLEFDGPYLLEIIVEREDKVFPMIPAGATVDEIRLE